MRALNVLLGHGSGGRLSAELMRDIFLPAFANPILGKLDDQAILDINGTRLAFTTDTFVVKPLFFRGGDIGSLAVHGTINDLAMGGAEPLYLSTAFIIEEGFPMDELQPDRVFAGGRGVRGGGAGGDRRYEGGGEGKRGRGFYQHYRNRSGAQRTRRYRRIAPNPATP